MQSTFAETVILKEAVVTQRAARQGRLSMAGELRDNMELSMAGAVTPDLSCIRGDLTWVISEQEMGCEARRRRPSS
jgi:hypothetical protein